MTKFDWNHEYAELPGLKVHYVRHGKGLPVILQHGWPEFWYVFHKNIPELAEHFDTDVETVQTGINELVKTGHFKMEWEQQDQIKLVPRMLKETVIHFAEQVLSGIEAGEKEEGAES